MPHEYNLKGSVMLKYFACYQKIGSWNSCPDPPDLAVSINPRRNLPSTRAWGQHGMSSRQSLSKDEFTFSVSFQTEVN